MDTIDSTAVYQPSAAEVAAVAALPGRIVEAWSRYDAAAFAAVFTEDATCVLPGAYCKGHEQIEGFMAKAFAGPWKGTTVMGTPLDLRFLSSEVAIVITQGGVLVPEETEVAPERAIRASWVAVKGKGSWSLAAYQNSPVAT